MSHLLTLGVLQQARNQAGGEWVLEFDDSDLQTGAYGNTDTLTIPEDVTIYASVIHYGIRTFLANFNKNGSNIASLLISASAESPQTASIYVSYSKNDTIKINISTDWQGDVNGILTLRHTNESGYIISTLEYNFPSPCYLTTACVHYKGLDDKGDELNAMRRLRDEFMNIYYPQETKDYYKYSPVILKNIPESEKADVMDRIYDSVKQVQTHLETDDFEAAREEYLTMYFKLKEKYANSTIQHNNRKG